MDLQDPVAELAADTVLVDVLRQRKHALIGAVATLALVVLAPISDPRATAWWLISIGVTSLGLVIRPAIQGFRMRHPRALALRVLILRFGLSAICYAGVASVGVIFGRRNLESGLTGLLVVVVVLLAIAVRNTWDLFSYCRGQARG